MAFKSSVQPLCRYCGKGIGKHTHTIWFGMGNSHMSSDYFTYRDEKPTSKAEVQRLVNQQVVSVGWSKSWKNVDGVDVEVRSHIDKATTWDGESYVDEFFCTQEHARRFGYAAARGGSAMKAYNDAMAIRREQERGGSR